MPTETLPPVTGQDINLAANAVRGLLEQVLERESTGHGARARRNGAHGLERNSYHARRDPPGAGATRIDGPDSPSFSRR